jgi:hypothetical protein
MDVSSKDLEFVAGKRGAAMITVGKDGMPKVARVGIAQVDGKLWSSATEARARTRRLRRDPRCVLYVPDEGFAWVALESTVTILDGPDVPQLSVRLFREMQGTTTGPITYFGKELDEPAFVQTMIDEGRIIYQFEVQGTYGLA